MSEYPSRGKPHMLCIVMGVYLAPFPNPNTICCVNYLIFTNNEHYLCDLNDKSENAIKSFE